VRALFSPLWRLPERGGRGPALVNAALPQKAAWPVLATNIRGHVTARPEEGEQPRPPPGGPNRLRVLTLVGGGPAQGPGRRRASPRVSGRVRSTPPQTPDCGLKKRLLGRRKPVSTPAPSAPAGPGTGRRRSARAGFGRARIRRTRREMRKEGDRPTFLRPLSVV